MRFLCLNTSLIDSNLDLIMFSIIAILSTVLMIFVGYKLLQVLQLTGYKLNGFLKWFKETKYSYMSRLFMLTFLSLASMLMTNVLLADFFVQRIFSYVSILCYVLFCSLFITNLFSAKQKTPLKYTKRMTRLVIVFAILIAGFTWGIQYVGYMYIPYLSFGLIAIIPVTLPLFVIIAYFITYPIEKLISISYLKKARKKLAEQKNILVIGVTGSFGKTSVKNILSTILEEKFKVCSTPASYNTPLGLSKTILKKLTNDDEILIAEMGAKQTGDIKELCEMVNPTIGVITGIGNQHLLTFGSLDNISKTKGELADYVSKSNGKIYFNVDTEAALNLSNKYKDAVKTAISTSEYDLKVESLKVDKDGSSFKLVYDKKKVECSTVLLGNHNVSNIVLAARIALDLGLSLEEISAGISKLKAIPHRLEILKSSAEYTIIDDAYNCSVEGSKASLEVLSRFEGKKIVITPGLVELGADQFNSNFEFGRDLAKVCDYVIIDSTINYDAISSGLIFAGFDENKIIQVVSLSKAVEMLKDIATKGDVVLFENDLPDNYS